MAMTLTHETQPRTFADTMRDRLAADRAELVASIARGAAELPAERSDVSDGPGETEFLATAEQHDLFARVDALARASLEEIDAALARLDAGTYGRCVTCSAEIPEERLDVMPATAHCVSCRQRLEGPIR
jgi:RNA polymerase-binding transcription factor DksA